MRRPRFGLAAAETGVLRDLNLFMEYFYKYLIIHILLVRDGSSGHTSELSFDLVWWILHLFSVINGLNCLEWTVTAFSGFI